MKTPRVAVIVLNWNGAPHLTACLDSVARLTYPGAAVRVVDNASTDGSEAELEARWPQFTVQRNATNLGYAGGNNAAIRATEGEYVLLVNNDTVLEPGLLEPLVAAAEADPLVAACSPMICYVDRPGVLNAAGLAIKRDLHPASRGQGELASAYTDPANVFGAHGACALYRRSALDRVGLLDEDFFAYHEEFDLAWRLQLAGYCARYVPAARLLHHEAASLRKTPQRLVYLMERNRIWAIAKNAGAGLIARHLPELIAAEWDTLRGAVGVRDATAYRARADAVLGLPRMLAKRRAVQALRTVPDTRIAAWLC